MENWKLCPAYAIANPTFRFIYEFEKRHLEFRDKKRAGALLMSDYKDVLYGDALYGDALYGDALYGDMLSNRKREEERPIQSSNYNGGGTYSPETGYGCLALLVIAGIIWLVNNVWHAFQPPPPQQPSQSTYSLPSSTPAAPQAPAKDYSQLRRLFADALATAERGECDNARTLYAEAESAVQQSGLRDANGRAARRARAAVMEREEEFAVAETRCRSGATAPAPSAPADQTAAPTQPAEGQKQEVIDQWLKSK